MQIMTQLACAILGYSLRRFYGIGRGSAHQDAIGENGTDDEEVKKRMN